VANDLAVQASVAGLKTIVFVQQADYAPTNAKKIANKLASSSALTAAEDLLWATIQAELGGAEFSLVRLGTESD
jgi:ATP-dependent RNA helicase HelY